MLRQLSDFIKAPEGAFLAFLVFLRHKPGYTWSVSPPSKVCMSGHDSLRYHGPPRHSPPEPAPPDPSHQQGLSKASTMPGPGSHTSLEELSCRNSSTNCSRMGNSRSKMRTDVAVPMATFESRTLSDHSELLCCRLNHQCFCHNFVEF